MYKNITCHILGDNDAKIFMTNGFSIEIYNKRRALICINKVNDTKINNHKMAMQNVPYAPSIKYDHSIANCGIDEKIYEMLFYKNILYLIEPHNDDYFKLSVIHFESENLTLASVNKWYENKDWPTITDTSNNLVVKEANEWNLSYFELIPIKNGKAVTLSDLFGLSFLDTDLYIHNMNMSSKKVEKIYCDNNSSLDSVIKYNPLAIASFRYRIVLEDGQDLYMYWHELANYLCQYVQVHNNHPGRYDKPKTIDLYVPNFYQS